MELNFICPVCFQEISTDDEMSGEQADCPTCEAEITVPEPAAPSTARLGGYTLEHCLGKGRLGMVYLATQVTMNRKVALRILTPDLTEDDEYVRRFIEETRLNARIEHPNVVSFYDVGEDKDRVYAAMSYVEGKSVLDLLDENGPFAEEDVIAHGLTIAKTLNYVNEQYDVLAQNLNPSNIFIDRHGEVKLMNLGVTRYQGEAPDPDASLTATSVIYMSPEQSTGAETDVRSDIFSLGVSLFQMLTGELPFTGDRQETSPKALRDDVSEHLDMAIQSMLQKDPTLRYQDWAGVIRDYERLADGEAPLRRPDGTVLDPEEAAAAAKAERQPPSLRLKSQAQEEKAAAPAPTADSADDDAEDSPPVAEAIPESEEEADADAPAGPDTPTRMESRDVPIDSGEAKEKQKAGPAKIAIRIVVVLLVLWGGFKYGFGPLISAMRKTESVVYVINPTDTNYKLRLGWRRLKQDLRGNGVAQFKLFVGMSEKQGLKAIPQEEGEKHKVKVPLSPGCKTLVNLNGGDTYYIYDEQRIADATLGQRDKLATQILNQQEPAAAYPVLQEIKKLGQQAFVEKTNAEIIDLTEYQPRMMMVGMALDHDKTLPIITEKPCTLTIADGQITYDAADESSYSGNLALGKAGELKVAGSTVQVPAGARLTISASGERLDVRTVTSGQSYTHKNVAYKGNWTYTAIKQPQKPWTWTWSFSGQVDRPDAVLRITVLQPNQGKVDIKTSEQKRNP